MFCQAGFLLYLRIKTRRFYLFKSNELGLVRVDCSNMFGLNFFVYSAQSRKTNNASSRPIIVAITDLACKDFKEVIGRPYLPWQIFLFGTRFIVALDATWSFFWVCVVHCATIKYRSPVSGTLFGRTLIPRSLSYAMNTSMILAVVWPITSMEYSEVVARISIITKALEQSASSYSSGHSFVSDLVITLIPASTVLVNMAYIPCLIVVIKSMYHRGLTPTRLEDDLTGKPTEGKTDKTIRGNTRDINQRNAVVLLAVFAYVSTLVHVPVLIWSVGGKLVLKLSARISPLVSSCALQFSFFFFFFSDDIYEPPLCK
ncbi:hypothetical protein CROQUDRAFT_50382 [Cronartium quercuum f. sp. fusiforme G11]|uniref:Uncharacterized protein n=1 Tax=Cronartium quercuum f. sp. fusiforme G11 TaxID=708437 RepID=A0A9P6N9B4_9BASI|nr:hypothetical protein CROQUDRAFT_50382 [Cronartium quercuum f. sp. fusiforme G11]